MFINMDVYVKRLENSHIKEIINEISGPDAEITFIKRVSTGVEVEVLYDGEDEEYYVLHDYFYESDVNNGTNSQKIYRKKMLELIGIEYAERFLLH